MGHFEAGEAINTVPSHGYLEGTIRTYDTEDLAIVNTKCIKLRKVFNYYLMLNVRLNLKKDIHQQ